MKKILYTTTALVAATVLSSAAMASGSPSMKHGSAMKSMKMSSTSELQSTRYLQQNDMMGASAFKATVGGYANWYMGWADNNLPSTATETTNEFDVFGDAEVHFNFEAALRNGMKVGATAQLTTDTTVTSAEIDETYMYMESMYGKVMVGRHDNVNEQLSIHSIDVGALDIQETDFTRFILNTGATKIDGVENFSTTYFNTDEELTKISYITPNFHGFQAGMTYAAAGSAKNDSVVRSTGTTQTYDATMITAAYAASIDGVGMAVSGGYGFNTNFTAGTVDGNIEQWNVGARVMYKGFSIASSYKDFDAKNTLDGHVWDVGVAYEMGPCAMSLAYIAGEAESNTNSTMLLSGKYNMAAGVDAFATVGWGDYETADNDGWAVITGMMLSF